MAASKSLDEEVEVFVIELNNESTNDGGFYDYQTIKAKQEN
jgi:hypothetical protein